MNIIERGPKEPFKYNLERPVKLGYREPNIGDFMGFNRETTLFINALHGSNLLPNLLRDENVTSLLAKAMVTREDLRVQSFVPPAFHPGGWTI